jgi:hypothetical protein
MRKKHIIAEIRTLKQKKEFRGIIFPEMADPEKWFREGYQAALDDMKETIENTHFPII